MREFERLAAGDPAAALELCRGDLLEGLEDDWALSARDRHRERVIELLEELAQRRRGARRGSRGARAHAAVRSSATAFDEDAHRRLIERLDAAGDRAGAMRVYRGLAERLRRELGVAPSATTRELVERLRAATPATRSPALLRRCPGDRRAGSPARCAAGRERELAELERTWAAAAGARARPP